MKGLFSKTNILGKGNSGAIQVKLVIKKIL